MFSTYQTVTEPNPEEKESLERNKPTKAGEHGGKGSSVHQNWPNNPKVVSSDSVSNTGRFQVELFSKTKKACNFILKGSVYIF